MPTKTTGRPVGRPRNGDVPGQLVGAATHLFAEFGYDGTSVQMIVEAAGVTKGGMYHYFGSKDDLLYSIYARHLQDQKDNLDRLVETDLPIREKLHAIAVDVIVRAIAETDTSQIFLRSMHQLAPDKRLTVRAERRAYHEKFRSVVEQGMASGDLNDAVPADQVVHYFFGALHNIGTWYRPTGRLTPEQIGTHFADLLMASLRP